MKKASSNISVENHQRVKEILAQQRVEDDDSEDSDEDEGKQPHEFNENDENEVLDSDKLCGENSGDDSDDSAELDTFTQKATEFEAQSNSKKTERASQQKQQRAAVADSGSSVSTGTGQRRAWEGPEMDALQAGVKKYGVGKWADIKADPEFSDVLEGRTNVSSCVSNSGLLSVV